MTNDRKTESKPSPAAHHPKERFELRDSAPLVPIKYLSRKVTHFTIFFLCQSIFLLYSQIVRQIEVK